MNCSRCGKTATVRNVTKKYTTVTGILSGGLLALKGAQTGALIGRCICPVFGDIAGGVIGFLTGAMAGGSAGNAVGRLLDENIVRVYHCDSCGHEWRAA